MAPPPNTVRLQARAAPVDDGRDLAVDLILVYARRPESRGMLQPATFSVAANRCDLIETSVKIVKMGQVVTPVGDCLRVLP